MLPITVLLAAIWTKFFYFDLLFQTPAPITFYLGVGIMGAILTSLIAIEFDLHSTSAIVSGQTQWRAILAAISLSFLLLLGLFYLLKISEYVSIGWFALCYVTAIGFLFFERLGILLWARLLRAENRLLQRVAIYGSIGLLERVIDKLFAEDRNLVLSGVFSDDKAPPSPSVPIQGGVRELVGYAQGGNCDRIVVALPSAESDKIRHAIECLEVLPINVQFSPDAMTVPDQISGLQKGGGLILLDVQRPPLSSRGILIKTVMDYVLSAIALPLLAPVMLLIAIAIKLDSAGPIFFVQSRHGHNHRIIRVVKFRTMTVAEDGPIVTQAVRGDKRVTRVGAFLRRSSLDELPQLFNVLRGELSLVGPRPHAVAHNESYSQILRNYANRHKVKPGITGWAQVNGFRGETKSSEDMRQRVERDLYYIKHWSPWLDIQILARTALVPFHGLNAH
jgi:putative colanic acid biosynthesis UDP-glucose lipid carrier transferase